MLSSRLLIGALALSVLLSGCTPSESVPTSPEQTATSTPAAAQPAAVIVSLDAIAVQDDDGATVESATFDDPDAVLDLVGELLGSTPAPVDQHQFGTLYEWPGVSVRVNFGTAQLAAEVPELGGLPLRTTEGIQVGSTRAEVDALSPFDAGHDTDGDGASDWFGLEPRSVPDIPSLTYPGQPGTEFIGIVVEGDTVAVLRAPYNDYTDV